MRDGHRMSHKKDHGGGGRDWTVETKPAEGTKAQMRRRNATTERQHQKRDEPPGVDTKPQKKNEVSAEGTKISTTEGRHGYGNAKMRLTTDNWYNFTSYIRKRTSQGRSDPQRILAPLPAACSIKKVFRGRMALTTLRPSDLRGTNGPLPTEYTLCNLSQTPRRT